MRRFPLQILQSKNQDYILYTVQNGDTLFKLGLTFNISLSNLIKANPMIEPNNIYGWSADSIPNICGQADA